MRNLFFIVLGLNSTEFLVLFYISEKFTLLDFHLSHPNPYRPKISEGVRGVQVSRVRTKSRERTEIRIRQRPVRQQEPSRFEYSWNVDRRGSTFFSGLRTVFKVSTRTQPTETSVQVRSWFTGPVLLSLTTNRFGSGVRVGTSSLQLQPV